MSSTVKYRYFELIRQGLSGAEAAHRVGVSLSCGSLRFTDAGGVSFVEVPISARYLSQDDRIAIAHGLARGEQVKLIASRIGRPHQTVYREIARNGNRTAVTNRGTPTPRPTFGGGDPSCAGSLLIPNYDSSSPEAR
jgi:hypothetical protein